MVVLNADGSRPEACGNGLRCVVLHLARTGEETEFTIGTDAGPRSCVALPDGTVRAEMGVASFPPIPGLGADIAVDVGNPHRVCFVGANDARLVAREGPTLGKHPAFEDGCNVGFTRLIEAAEADQASEPAGAAGPALSLAVWERGVGPTQACGSGACAAAAAAVRRRLVPEGAVRVDQPGGTLIVEVGPPGDEGARTVTMTGPAQHVFSGDFE